MRVIALIGQKGGTGKTTATIGLAVAAERAGFKAAILDLDPQTNAANWKDRRTAEGPAVESIQPGRLRQTLKLAEGAGAEIVFIDTPGKSDTAGIAAAGVADLALIPVHAQIFDLETLDSVRNILRLAGNPPAYLVLNFVHPTATRSPTEQRQVISTSTGLPACPVHLSRLDIFGDSPATGQTPQEVDPMGKAARELEALFAFVDKTAKPTMRFETAPVHQEAVR